MLRFEPKFEVSEKSSTFLSLRWDQTHLRKLSEEYLGKKYLTDMAHMMQAEEDEGEEEE